MYGDSRFDAIAILPTGESINPANPDKAHWLYSDDLTALVLFKTSEARTRPTRVATTFGGPGDYRIGQKLHFQHDQTGAYFGEYEIVGIHHFASGETAGDVPDRKIKHSVFK